MKPKIIAVIVIGLIAAGVILQLPSNSKSKTATLPTPVKQAAKKNDPCFPPKPAAEQISLDKTKTFGAYEVRLYWDAKCYAGGMYEILKDGQVLYSEGGGKFHIGTLYTKNDPHAVQNGQDITGDGVSDLVITEWSGGAHCCMTVRVFQIGDEFKFKLAIHTQLQSPDVILGTCIQHDCGILHAVSRPLLCAGPGSVHVYLLVAVALLVPFVICVGIPPPSACRAPRDPRPDGC